ncbi:MAG: hypothetical protein J7J54_06190 [Candidatus Omnitrophica bacterium]|nr:hypothetical protein [Candidatus Omnitrophota bacterium]
MELLSEEKRRKSLVKDIKDGKLGKDLKFNKNFGIWEKAWTGESEVDIVFKDKRKKLIGIEVKRDNINLHGALEGLGQALAYLKYCHSSYLAIPKTHQETIKWVIEKVGCSKHIGLIVFEGNDYDVVVRAGSQGNLHDDYLSRRYDMGEKWWYTKWVCPIRDEFIDKIFETSIQQSGRIPGYGKFRLILFLHSLYNLMIKSNKGILDEFRDRLITGNWSAGTRDIDRFVNEFEQRWFSFNEIYEQSKKICRDRKEIYGRIHSKASLKHSRDELVSIGIVEVRKLDDKNKLYYRINPFFLENLSRLINEWEKFHKK